MGSKNWLAGLAPDVALTLKRFPLPLLLIAIFTIIFLGVVNDYDSLRTELWARALLGLAAGAVFGVGGVLFVESRPELRKTGLALAYAVPLLVVASAQITDTTLFMPFLLPVIAVLWVSVAAFTRIGRGAEREELQNRFWWLNHQAVVTAALAVMAFALIALGLVAIERAMLTLFHLDSARIFYMWVLPFVGVFLVPIYWLATLPRPDDYDAAALDDPDFLSRAVSFIGQFILAPLLGIYGLILLAYTVQIIVTQRLPEGMLGWMVLGFVITGAANWLLLHPAFMRQRLVVRLFRRWWFWLTLIPLALFFYAVFVRIGAYGLTAERVGLIAGGVWAGALAVAFLARRGDIRLIPGLAGVIMLVLSVGPWNAFNLPVADQAARLEGALRAAGPERSWTEETAASAQSAINYLYYNGGKPALERLLAAHGQPVSSEGYYPMSIMAALGVDSQGTNGVLYEPLNGYRTIDMPVDVTATPLLLGRLMAWNSAETNAGSIAFNIVDNQLVVAADKVEKTRVPLADWVAQQSMAPIVQPWIDFSVDGRAFRYVLDSFGINVETKGRVRTLTSLDGNLFTVPPVTPRP